MHSSLMYTLLYCRDVSFPGSLLCSGFAVSDVNWYYWNTLSDINTYVRNDDCAITRQLRTIILRTLLRTFSNRSIYCSRLWHIYTKTAMCGFSSNPAVIKGPISHVILLCQSCLYWSHSPLCTLPEFT